MPKRFRREISASAQQDVASTYDLIFRDKPRAAAKWLRAFDRQVASLRYLPMRHEVIPEADEIGYPYRHIIWGNYRIIFKVEDNLVTIVRVFHSARLLKSRHFED